MCGRICLYSGLDEVTQHFALTQNVVLTPRYNIAPAQVIPVIRAIGNLEFITWGLRPAWLQADQNSFINARLETLSEKPAFRHAFKSRRCLIVVNGYYEWRPIGAIKQPYLISRPEKQLFALAGIWEADTVAIITTQAQQPEIRAVHPRMPLVIDPKGYQQWLDPKTKPADLQLLLHDNSYIFTVSPVSTKVNNPKHDMFECTLALQ